MVVATGEPKSPGDAVPLSHFHWSRPPRASTAAASSTWLFGAAAQPTRGTGGQDDCGVANSTDADAGTGTGPQRPGPDQATERWSPPPPSFMRASR